MDPIVTIVTLPLVDTPTSPSCCDIVVTILKYVLHNTHQTPYDIGTMFPAIVRAGDAFIAKQRAVGGPTTQLNKEIARSYEPVKAYYDAYNALVDHLFLELNAGNVEEVLFFYGDVQFNPKCVFKIHLPPVPLGHSMEAHPINMNTEAVGRALLESKELQQILATITELRNFYILLVKEKGTRTITESFLRFNFFRIPLYANILSIFFSEPEDTNCDCPGPGTDDEFDSDGMILSLDGMDLETALTRPITDAEAELLFTGSLAREGIPSVSGMCGLFGIPGPQPQPKPEPEPEPQPGPQAQTELKLGNDFSNPIFMSLLVLKGFSDPLINGVPLSTRLLNPNKE